MPATTKAKERQAEVRAIGIEVRAERDLAWAHIMTTLSNFREARDEIEAERQETITAAIRELRNL